MQTDNKQFPIDFVVTWVDGNDPEWQEEKRKYSPPDNSDSRDRRYRDMDLLQYWFRGVEKFAPWVHRIFFVTCGHLPKWLDTGNPKLRIIKHSDFIPAEFLPTFSCRAIELNLHRIPGLSEHFVYFNDDMFIKAPVREKDFFRHGLPNSKMTLSVYLLSLPKTDKPGDPLRSAYLTLPICMAVINRNFSKKEAMRRNWRKWFSPRNGKDLFKTVALLPWNRFSLFSNEHLPYPYLKSTFEEVWRKEEKILRRACLHRFRESVDVSSRLMTYWQIAKGTVSAGIFIKGQKYIISDDNIAEALAGLGNPKIRLVCLNDAYEGENFDRMSEELRAAFEKILPEKSSYERI